MDRNSNGVGIKRIPPFRQWEKNKLFVIHMETINLDLEDCLRSNRIPFKSTYYKDIKEIDRDLKESIGIIISGSIKKGQGYPDVPKLILDSSLPKLGICYGCEVLGVHLGSKLILCNSGRGEYGETVAFLSPSRLFEGMNPEIDNSVFMAHHLMLDSIPSGCKVIAKTDLTPIAGFETEDGNIFGLQFHPEKDWMGQFVFQNFLEICRSKESGVIS